MGERLYGKRVRWKMKAGVFSMVMVSSLLLSSYPGEVRGFFTNSQGQAVNSEWDVLNSHHVLLVSERASSSRVGSIMALLATFDEAGILPPEGTPHANQIIHALIQLQSALMKSPSSELAAYRDSALTYWTQKNPGKPGSQTEEGLTARMLAALVVYDLEHPLWENEEIVTAFGKFNVTRSDWMLIVELFHNAEGVFLNQGRTIQEVYESWRTSMPGGKS